MRKYLLAIGATVLLLAPSITAAHASSLKITDSNGSPLAVLDRDTIEATGMQSIKTVTPWTNGVVHFEGSPIQDVLAQSGITGRNVTALAFDDYAVSISAETIAEYAPIIATRLNGEFLTLDDKGPFWIIFDFDDIPEERSTELWSQAVWHLIEFEVE